MYDKTDRSFFGAVRGGTEGKVFSVLRFAVGYDGVGRNTKKAALQRTASALKCSKKESSYLQGLLTENGIKPCSLYYFFDRVIHIYQVKGVVIGKRFLHYEKYAKTCG